VFVVALYSTPIGLSHQTLTAVQRSGCVAGFSYLIWFLARFEQPAGSAAVRPRDDGSWRDQLFDLPPAPFIVSRFVRPEMNLPAAHTAYGSSSWRWPSARLSSHPT